MAQQYPTVAKIPILDTGKFEQWQFRIQQYLQHEHYALWEVIEFGDSYEVPTNTTDTTTTTTTSGETGTKSGRTVTLTAEDMQKKKNDVEAKTTLLLSLPDEHQLRFSKYKTARELWAAILKTFGGNEATKKTKKNLLKQQYGNFRAEGSKTLEQMFSRLQVIVGQLQLMDVEVEQDDLNQKSDLDTMSLDDLYNHLKVYESEVQKKTERNSQNMAFISSAKHISGNEDGNTTCVPTASTNVLTASASMDIKWNMALLSMRADEFWKRTRKKISIQGSDVAGFDKSKVECFNCHKMGSFARETLEFYNESNKECIETLKKKLETLKQEKEGVDGKLTGLLTASKDLDNLIESQRSDKNKEGLGYTAVPPPPVQLYLSPKKDLSWTGLPEFADNTVTDYSRPAPPIECTSEDGQNQISSASENGEPTDSILSYGAPMRPSHRLAGHRPHGPPMRSNMNGARPKKTSAVRPQYRAP
nr:hypothetical protein [Tanacetum cinerariifolium]